MSDGPVYLEPQPPNAGKLFEELLGLTLYGSVTLPTKVANVAVRSVRTLKRQFDAYCPGCSRDTLFVAAVDDELIQREKQETPNKMTAAADHVPKVSNWMGPFRLRVVCSRWTSHVADYYFETDGPNSIEQWRATQNKTELRPTKIIKVGQYPSITDFQVGDLKQFEDGMSTAQRKEFVRAINCTAHGFHVAACVHFRRVFESILIEARDDYTKSKGLEEWPEFRKARTDERIAMLKGFLPEFMSENPSLYGILSLGVHELTEEQCKREMPMLRQAIELIMRDRVMAVQLKKQREDVRKLVAQATDRHKDAAKGG